MAVSRGLRRLLRIRELQEEQSRLGVETALGELKRQVQALSRAKDRERGGRRLVQESARSGELPDRLAGMEEGRAAEHHAAVLIPRIAKAELDVSSKREEFLARRLERRQAETLIQEAEAEEVVETERRGQQALDDWYRNRLRGAGANGERLEALNGEKGAS